MDPVVKTARNYALLLRLHRPIGIYLLMWPTLWALWIAAKGPPPLGVLTIFVLGTITMRSAGCVINDYLDRHIDGKVARTRNRPIVNGDIKPKEALVTFGALILFGASLVLLTNRLTILLAVIGFFLATTYPLTKRFCYLPQFHLGFAFSWSIPMAFSAILGTVPNIAWSLFLTTVIWTVAYDTFYAMADKKEDIQGGIKSLSVLFGEDDIVATAILQIIFVIFLIIIGQKLELMYPYYVGLGLVSVSFIYQRRLITSKDGFKCMKAFENNNFVGGIIFCGIAMSYHISLST